MRKLFFLIAFVGLAIVVFYSCKKDKIQTSGNENNTVLDFMTQEDIQTRDRILKFRDNIGNHLKSDEVIALNNAIWNIEATINYTYCWHDFEYKPLPHNSLFYQLPLNSDGQILQSDVDSIYQQIISDLTTVYDAIDAETKHMIFTNIKEINSNRDGLTTSIIVTTGFGFNPLFVYGSFDEGEDWMYGNLQGMCNDTTIESDAAEEIEYLLNNPENPPSYNGRVYFTDPVFRTLDAIDWLNLNDTTSCDNLYDFLMFFNSTVYPNYHECLTHEEMNFYLAGTAYVINTYEPEGKRPEGLTFITIDLESSQMVSHIFHVAFNSLKYGILHITNDPPSDL